MDCPHPLPPPSFWQWVKNLDIQAIPGAGQKGVILISTRQWPFHWLGRNAQESSAQRGTGEEPGGCPMDRHLRLIWRKEREPFVGRSYPVDADEYNPLLACAYKSVSQNWGGASLSIILTRNCPSHIFNAPESEFSSIQFLGRRKE